jgi:hypothetical protein
MLQLPVSNLASALQQMPPAITLRAAQFLSSPDCGPLPQQTQALVRDKAASIRAAQEAAAKAEVATDATSTAEANAPT